MGGFTLPRSQPRRCKGPGVFWGGGITICISPATTAGTRGSTSERPRERDLPSPSCCSVASSSTHSLPAAAGIPGAPVPQGHILLRVPTHDIQVLPHHALGVGAQEDVEVQNPARRAPRQGRARLQDDVWGRHEHRRSEMRTGPQSSPVPQRLRSTHPWRCCSAGRRRGPNRRPLSPGRKGGSRTG